MTERTADKRPEQIENEIARTRADMDSTLDAIQRKLSPTELMDQAMNYVRHTGADQVIGGIGRTMRDNPIPIALIGLGCAWLLYSGVSSRRDGERRTDDGRDMSGGDYYPAANGGGEGRFAALRDGASRTAEAVTSAAHDAVEGVREAARTVKLGEYARDGMGRARHGYDAMVADRPLALGAIGLAVGAAVGLMLPATRQEDEALGEYRDQVFEQAQAAGREQVQKAQTVANEAWRAAKETVKEEAAKQGLAGAPAVTPTTPKQATAGMQPADSTEQPQFKRPRPVGSPAQG